MTITTPASIEREDEEMSVPHRELADDHQPREVVAQELLRDAFFTIENSKDSVYNHMQLFNSAQNSFDLPESQSHGIPRPQG